ncbi:ATP-binding cassette domain-containing protein [Stenotrophomonas maltophilia]|uniref:iron ABC transporter ATP-binding protein n=1 Tax=Stenotrophomonas maltophilia TaxID=40324 RepID=UPI001D12507C|nr:ATP-binding cassette domain-containing protein [Stenotrophomonas maltophilia]UKJ25476.1 ATP-binding cassette domain-containing protein [Stenotrophomonas maltophilia]UXB29265.1 ATP-binding cassette domain-containing protein [Stenotrophomonas maltophilia]WDW04427.1 ATP-binding cassette domain-containing protein [Stenotrophomonas maltophilia]
MLNAMVVTKNYDQTAVVKDVSLAVPEGKLTALIGPNGAGKSTLLSMLARLTSPTGGVVLLDGKEISALPSDVVARRLAILRQANQVSLRLTVRDLVRFGRYPHSQGSITEEDRRKIEQAISYLHLNALADRYLDEISGGERQRAFIAMALAQDTHYLLLDEPLNSLDMKQAVTMMGVLRRAVDELGKTIVVVLHDINFASTYADHIVAMKSGTIVVQGSPSAVMKSTVLKEIYEIPISVHQIRSSRLCVFYGNDADP